MEKPNIFYLPGDSDAAREILDALEEGPGRNMDRAFALHVLGWRLEGESAISPTGSHNANDEKYKDQWLEYYSTSLEAIAPAVFENHYFSSAELRKSPRGIYRAVVRGEIKIIGHSVHGGKSAVGLIGISFSGYAAAALCRAALMCKLDEIDKAAALDKRLIEGVQ